MKRFNIAHGHQPIYGHSLPINAVYGKYNNIVYYVDDFRPIKLKNGTTHYAIHVLNPRTNRYYETYTSMEKRLFTLSVFLREQFEKNGINEHTTCIYYKGKIDVPKLKKSQSPDDMIYRPQCSPHGGVFKGSYDEYSKSGCNNADWRIEAGLSDFTPNMTKLYSNKRECLLSRNEAHRRYDDKKVAYVIKKDRV